MSQNNTRPRRNILLLLFLSLALLLVRPAQAQPKFTSSQIAGPSSDLLVCDLDGDGLQDLIRVNDVTLSIFYQDRAQGFTREPQQLVPLDHRPCVLWSAKLDGPSDHLFVMTSDGVTELDFTNRASPPARRRIIRQRTIVPDAPEKTASAAISDFDFEPQPICLTMSATTKHGWPLLLVPTAEGIQVWQHRDDEWTLAQLLSHTITSLNRPSPAEAGYTASVSLDFSIGDVNADGRDDLIVHQSKSLRASTYALYLQQTNGLFTSEPLTYTDKTEPYSWLNWTDLNHDGHLDLIKSVWLNEPSFVPGNPSGKVVVSIFTADSQGRLPAAPQQVFRKSDWTPALPVVDVDGDGYPDLVLGFSQIDTREGLRKEIAAKQLDYNLRFFFYRPGAGYPAEADCQRNIVLHMEQAELLISYNRSRYFQNAVKLDGDFNGDGKADLLVRDQSDTLSAYFFISREKGFSANPDLRFNCPEKIESWQAQDLNHDGISDLIVRLANQAGYRIFTSQNHP